MKKTIYIILFILGCLLLFSLNCFTVTVFFNPDTNTNCLRWITPVIKELNHSINESIKTLNLEDKNIKLLYTNAYGSGFLKHNKIPNDLDFAVGINLGTYDFDGTNEDAITKSIFDTIRSFEVSLYYNLDEKFYTPYSKISSLNLLSEELNGKDLFSDSIKHIVKNKDYILYTKKQLENTDSSEYITFPFIMKSNEILIEDLPPVTLYSANIKYSSLDKDYPKEITIVPDYIFTLNDTQTGKNYVVTIVAESFKGQRLQLSRRFYVPQIFTETSHDYFKTLSFLYDDEKYIEYRLYNFERLLNELSNLNLTNDRPVKKLKRILQIENLIKPALNIKTCNLIENIIEENLNSEEVQALNEYSNIYGNLLTIMQTPKIFFDMQNNNEIQKCYNIMKEDLNSIKNSKNIDKTALENLTEYTNTEFSQITQIKTQQELIKFLNETFINAESTTQNMQDCFISVIKNRHEQENFVQEAENVFIRSGFHKIDMGWLDKDLIGIVEDDFTKNLSEEQLKQMAKENNLADVNYVLIPQEHLNKIYVKHSRYVRFKPTKKENENWNILKSQLLKDKKNFSPKYRFVFSIK